MARKLTKMTWDDVQQEMSMAGNPKKITQLGKDVMALCRQVVDVKNIPDLINAQFALQRIIAELRLWEKMERQRQHGKG